MIHYNQLDMTMNKVILRQKRIGFISQGPYDVYVDGDYVGTVGRFSTLTFTIESEKFDLTMRYHSFFSSSKECRISKDNTILEYEPADTRLLIVAVVWDFIAVFSMLFHFQTVPLYVWLCGIFGIPVIAFFWQLIRRKHYFNIKVVDQ